MNPREIAHAASTLVKTRRAVPLLLFGLLSAISVAAQYGTWSLDENFSMDPDPVAKVSMMSMPIGFTAHMRPARGPSSIVKRIGALDVQILGESGGLKLKARVPTKANSISTAMIALIAITAPLMLVGAFISSFGEASLIGGVKELASGAPFSVAAGARVGLAHFGKLLALDALFGALFLLTIALVLSPTFLMLLGFIATGLSSTASVTLAIAAVPWLLTLEFIRKYSNRIAVLDGEGIFNSIRKARLFLRGRVKSSLMIFWSGLVYQIAMGLLAGVAIGFCALAIFSHFFGASSRVPEIVDVMWPVILVAPFAAFFGAYRSALWTLAFLKLPTMV